MTAVDARAAIVALVVALHGGPGCSLPATEPDAGAARCAPLAPRAPGLVVAGSGSNLAVVRRIARRCRATYPAAPVTVPDSIGTGGALRALRDRAIDVGLASRGLRAAERAAGAVETPFAATPLVLVAHPRVTVEALSPPRSA